MKSFIPMKLEAFPDLVVSVPGGESNFQKTRKSPFSKDCDQKSESQKLEFSVIFFLEHILSNI